MKHPYTRLQRRVNGEIFRMRMRKRMLNTWYTYRPNRIFEFDPVGNRMWWARKQCVGHGNRCSCNCEKILERRKRRLALDAEIENNLKSFEDAV